MKKKYKIFNKGKKKNMRFYLFLIYIKVNFKFKNCGNYLKIAAIIY